MTFPVGIEATADGCICNSDGESGIYYYNIILIKKMRQLEKNISFYEWVKDVVGKERRRHINYVK